MPNASELATPRSAQEAGALLLEASGSGRSVSLARPGGEVVVSTSALNRVIEHEATDLTCVVEPGVTLSELDEQLAPHGQRLALDPPGDPTIGECILDDLSGPRRHRYGAVRDLILGVTVALADGTVASSGGKVVKNVAGYDLAKLFCGSHGTLGLVVRAAFRLHPRPETSATLEVAVDSPRGARDAVRALQRSTLVPSALDLLWPGRLLTLLEGSSGVVAAQSDDATRLVGAANASNEVWGHVREDQSRALGALAFSPGDLDELLLAEASALVRPSVGVAYLERTVEPRVAAGVHVLRARVREAFDPGGVLVG